MSLWARYRLKLLAASSASLLAATAAANAFDGTIRMGVQISQTGAASFYGAPALEGIRYTAKKINDAGGLNVGGKKYQVEIIARDDGSSPETARAVATQLLAEDKVDVLIAGVYSNIIAGVLPIAERYGTPTITTFGYSPTTIPAGAKFSFNNVMTTVDQFAAPLDFLKSLGIKTIALAATNDDLGEGFMKAMPGILERAGFKVVGVERFEGNTTNFAPIMARIRNMKADGLIVEAGQPLTFQFRKAQAQYRACEMFKATVYEFGPTLQPGWVDATGESGIGALGQSFWWSTQKGGDDRWYGNNLKFVEEFKAAHGKTPVWGTAQGVQAIEVMALAIEHAGSLDKTAIANAFKTLGGSTLYGPIKYDSDHFNRGFVDRQLVIQQQGPRHEDAKIVYPLSEAEAKYMPDKCGAK